MKSKIISNNRENNSIKSMEVYVLLTLAFLTDGLIELVQHGLVEAASELTVAILIAVTNVIFNKPR